MAIEQQNGDYNLYSGATVFNKTAGADGVWELDIRVGDGSKNLHTNAATLTLTVTVAGETVGGGAASVAKDSGVLRARLSVLRFHVANGETVTAVLASNNSNDTDVDVTVVPRQVLDANVAANAVLDQSNGIESGVTPRQALRVMAAVLAGKVSGAGSGVESFVGMDGATTRVQVYTDSSGNRTYVTYWT
jgi:hypothetical protein